MIDAPEPMSVHQSQSFRWSFDERNLLRVHEHIDEEIHHCHSSMPNTFQKERIQAAVHSYLDLQQESLSDQSWVYHQTNQSLHFRFVSHPSSSAAICVVSDVHKHLTAPNVHNTQKDALALQMAAQLKDN